MCVDRHDATFGNGALHREDVGHALDGVLVGVFRRAGDLLHPVDAVERRADGARDELHLHGLFFPSSARSSSVRTRTLRASGTLNALPGRSCASASSASAARPNISSVAGAPRSTAPPPPPPPRPRPPPPPPTRPSPPPPPPSPPPPPTPPPPTAPP